MPRGRPKKDSVQTAVKSNNGANLGFEAKLFLAADKLRGNLEPSEYKHVVLGLIFLKYISDAFEAKREALLKRLDAYLCELKESQIRDGLHRFGLTGATSLETGLTGDACIAVVAWKEDGQWYAQSITAERDDDGDVEVTRRRRGG